MELAIEEKKTGETKCYFMKQIRRSEVMSAFYRLAAKALSVVAASYQRLKRKAREAAFVPLWPL